VRSVSAHGRPIRAACPTNLSGDSGQGRHPVAYSPMCLCRYCYRCSKQYGLLCGTRAWGGAKSIVRTYIQN
jgi:hypothetical protein